MKLRNLRFLFFVFLIYGGNLWAMASRPADPTAPPPPAWTQWVPIVVMVGVFYFFLIRPQTQQKKKREELMNSLKRGDQVLTQSGILATIVSIGPRYVEVKLNEETKVKMLRSGIQEVLSEPAEKEAQVVSS